MHSVIPKAHKYQVTNIQQVYEDTVLSKIKVVNFGSILKPILKTLCISKVITLSITALLKIFQISIKSFA